MTDRTSNRFLVGAFGALGMLGMLGASLVACTGEITNAGDGDGSGSGSNTPPVCEVTRSYAGFGGRTLESDRVALEAGADRARMKPFGALAAEYARALALSDVDTSDYAATFGRPPARWFEEPSASANTVYAAFALAFDLCNRHTANGDAYAAAPTTASATETCRTLAKIAWDREPSEDEVTACATFTADKTDAADPPRRRWAYGCAAVLSATGFLTY